MQHRSISWKQLLNLHKQEFLVWLDESGQRIKMFNKLADDLDRCIIFCLTPRPYGEDLSTLCKRFVDCIPSVFNNCDDPEMYDKELMAAPAYAHVHLLERYRRCWDILICLISAAVLPMSDKEIEVLDVGTGPAPAQYAVFDFYQALREFANEKGYKLLAPQPLNLVSVESSRNMAGFMHLFSEMSNRTGPFRPTFIDFSKLNFAQLRENKRWEIRQGEDYYDYQTKSWETWYEDVGNLGWTEGLYRYNLVIFSNFLTKKDEVEKWREVLLSTFSTVRHGGIVLVAGGSGEKYQPIYNIVSGVAKETALQSVPSASKEICCEYSDAYARRIKEHYNTIWRWIKGNIDIDDDFLRSYTVKVRGRDQKIAKKLWNPKTKLKGSSSPKEFTVLTFRRNGQPWKKIKKGD